MHIVHDPERNFWYYGKVEPYPGMVREKLWDAKKIVIDVETISLKEKISIGIGITTDKDFAFYFPLFPKESTGIPWHLLRSSSVEKIIHNAPFDLLVLREYEIYNGNILDTSSMGRLLGHKFNDLATLSGMLAMQTGDTCVSSNMGDVLRSHGASKTLQLPVEVVAKKCCEDCMATKAIEEWLYPKVMEYNKEAFEIDMAIIPSLMDMSFRGLLIDHSVRIELEEELATEVSRYRNQANDIGFNIGSSQQLSYELAERGAYRIFKRLPYTNRKRNQLSTDKEVLKVMTDPLAKMALAYRESSYLLSHYVTPMAKEERAQTRFHLDAATGRPSSTDRNMQNIPPGRPRNMYLPDSGVWTDLDFKQIELRILAYISQDQEMLHIFDQPEFLPDGSLNPEADIHQQTADFLGIPRKASKNTNFAMIYGATDQTIMETAGITDVRAAHRLKDKWGEKFTGAFNWMNQVQWEAKDNPVATTIFGRKLRLPHPDEEGLAAVQRKAVNYPIQGSAAEVLKRALIICHKKGFIMSLQVHDEILFDGWILKEQLQELEHIIPDMLTPISVKYLGRWE